MRLLGTSMVCTVEVEGTHVAACWDGGPAIAVFVEGSGQPRRAAEWPIWNPAWGSPLIQPTRESFERFVVGRLSEPGAVEGLIEAAAAYG